MENVENLWQGDEIVLVADPTGMWKELTIKYLLPLYSIQMVNEWAYFVIQIR